MVTNTMIFSFKMVLFESNKNMVMNQEFIMKRIIVVLIGIVMLCTSCNSIQEMDITDGTTITTEVETTTSEEVIVTSATTETSESSETTVITKSVLSISPSEKLIELDIASEDKNHFTSNFTVSVSGADSFKPEDIILLCEDTSIATVEYDPNTTSGEKMGFIVRGISVGETSIYAKLSDDSVVSEKIMIKVIETKSTPTPEPTKTQPTERMVWISKSGKNTIVKAPAVR